MKQLSTSGLIIVGCLLANLTYAANLWGGIDNPTKPPKGAAQPAGTAPANQPVTVSLPTSIDAPLPPEPEKPALPSKNTCDILKGTIVLRPEVMNTPEMQDQLKRTFKIIPDMNKFLVADPQKMTDLYRAYRDQYMKKYCTK